MSDKEEVGSMGNTGMESNVFDMFVSELLNKANQNYYNQFLQHIFFPGHFINFTITWDYILCIWIFWNSLIIPGYITILILSELVEKIMWLSRANMDIIVCSVFKLEDRLCIELY